MSSGTRHLFHELHTKLATLLECTQDNRLQRFKCFRNRSFVNELRGVTEVRQTQSDLVDRRLPLELLHDAHETRSQQSFVESGRA